MKLSEELQQLHDSGDCGSMVEGFIDAAFDLELERDEAVASNKYLRQQIKQLEQERDQLRDALEVVTNELESWAATEEDPDSIRAIQLGKRTLKRILMGHKKSQET